MDDNKVVQMLGYASGFAAHDSGSATGPLLLQQSPFIADLKIVPKFKIIVQSTQVDEDLKYRVIAQQSQVLAQNTAELTKEGQFFIVLGGDHSSAIGTWSGVAVAKRDEGPIGLIWVDAHMDSHTPETTISGNIHGMPLAALLGYGDKRLTQILDKIPKLNPQNICLIGVRSFEAGEAELLKKLNVKIYFMNEIKQRGLEAIFSEAIDIVSRDTIGYGISIDIDSMDPIDAPATGCVEPNGIAGEALCNALLQLHNDPKFIAAEIAEFDPHYDMDHRTEKLIAKMIKAMTLGK